MKVIEVDRVALKGLVWPIGIVLWLAVVVAVNVGFIVMAVDGADPVAEAYEAGER